MRNFFQYFKSLLSIILISITGLNISHAQSFRFENEKYVEPMVSWLDTPLLAVQHDYWSAIQSQGASWYTNNKFKSVDNYIVLGINHKTLHMVADFDLKFKFKIKGYKASGNIKNVTLEIDLSYRKDSLIAYQDQHIIKLEDTFHYFEVYMDEVVTNDINNTTINLNDIPVNVFLEGRINCQLFNKTAASNLFNTAFVNSKKEGENLRIACDYNTPNVYSCNDLPLLHAGIKQAMYEFEWLYIDNYNITDYTSGNATNLFTSSSFNIAYDFRNNASRVQTYKNHFDIPLVYGKGVLIYRVRMIRPSASNYSELVYYPWSLPDYGTLTPSSFNNSNPFQKCVSSSMYFINNAFAADKLNWMHNLSFAEEGKQKSVVSYFDGTGKSRQVQTRLSSDPGYVIVVDQVYDKEGRPSITTLPVPVQADNLHYKNDITLNAVTGTPYKAEDFDIGCASDSIAGLHATSKASLYYSPLNPDQSGMQKFVPDAEGYPFIETIYSPDATNKVLWQGGAGINFQRTGKGTSYSYVTANQLELNRYFGAETGYFQYYPKQFITDPNGQSSFNIMSPSGKVVLSGLAGEAPADSLHAIDPLGNVPLVSSVTFDVLNGAQQDIGYTYRNFSYSFLPEGAGLNSYLYKGSISPYNTGCPDKFIKMPAYYDVLVSNECGDTVAFSTGNTGSSFELVSSANAYSFSNPSVNFTPTTDRHVISKKLSFPDSFLLAGSKAFTLANMGQGSSYCYVDSNLFIRTAIEQTEFPCDTLSINNECDLLKRMLMDDLYPGSKYGTYGKDNNGKFNQHDTNSIFSIMDNTGYLYKTPIDIKNRKIYKFNVEHRSTICDSDVVVNYVAHPTLPITCPDFSFAPNCPWPSQNFDVWITKENFPLCYAFYNLEAKNIPYHPSFNRYRTYYNIDSNLYGHPYGHDNGFITGPLDSIEYLFRYQATCLGNKNIYVGHIWPGVYPNDSIAIADLEPDQLIAVFNDEIAEYLLPLHPEYCKLLACDPSNYLDTIAKIESWDDAVFLGKETLDKIAAADPMNVTYNVKGVLTHTELKNLRIDNTWQAPLDSLAIWQTYTANPFAIIPDTGYRAFIQSKTISTSLENEVFYKGLYVRNMVEAYTSNRNLRLQQFKDDANASCAPCGNTYRMKLDGEPSLPVVFYGDNLSYDMDVPAWVKDLYNNAANGNAPNTVSSEIMDSIAANNEHLCNIQLDEVISGLRHCVGMSAANETAIRNYLKSSTACTEYKGESITPALVKNAIESVLGPSALNDLCNPFLIAYNKFNNAQHEKSKDYLPFADTFYEEAAIFINKVLDAKSASLTQVLLEPHTSTYEFKLAAFLQMNTSSASMLNFNYWEGKNVAAAENGMDAIITLTNGTNSEQIYIAPNFNKTYDNLCIADTSLLLNGDNIRFTSAASVLKHPMAKDGVSVFMQNAMLLQGAVTGNPVPCLNYIMRHRYMPMQQLMEREELGETIHCSDIKKAVQSFMADTVSYKYSHYINTAAGSMALKNYLNHYFGKKIGLNAYLDLMEGCHLSDSIYLPEVKEDYELKFANQAAYDNFKSAFKIYFADTVQINDFNYSTGNNASAQVISLLALSQYDFKLWSKIKGFITVNILPTEKNYHKLFSTGELAQVFIAEDTSCAPALPYTSTTYYRRLLDGTYTPVKAYNVPTTGSTLAHSSAALKTLYTELDNVSCAKLHMYKSSAFLRSQHAFTSQQEAYLQYVYGLEAANHTSEVITTFADIPTLKNDHSIAGALNNNYTYINVFKEHELNNLYYPITHHTANIAFVNNVLDKVKNTLPNQSLFPLSRTQSITPTGLTNNGLNINQLHAYHTSDNGIWYRMFDEHNNRFNIYIKANGKNLIPLPGYTYIVGSLKMKPNTTINAFSVQLRAQQNGIWDTLTCYGYTDMPLGTGGRIANIVISSPVKPLGTVDSLNCEAESYQFAVNQGILQHRRYADSIVQSHYAKMKNHFPNNTIDTLNLSTTEKKYHFTAYYYDLAGNLTKTVPPAGIVTLAAGNMSAIDAARNNGTPYSAYHQKTSRYRYNTLNQLIIQVTPDGDTTKYFYDKYNRLVFSQNAKQKSIEVYSYTLYDALNRIIEIGQVHFPLTLSNYVNYAYNSDGAGNIVTQVRALNRKYVTTTVYDQSDPAFGVGLPVTQENLQNRVVNVFYSPKLSINEKGVQSFSYASHFSYDVMGNVKTLIQQQPELYYIGEDFKIIDYDYDLLSGKVNMLSYNRGKSDQYYHKYEYDADNRIQQVYTSNDGQQWDRDASYTYYKHGPLATLELGDLKVQQVQYAYTIQGWLKATNADVLHADADMGKDGLTNPLQPKDVFAHALSYHSGDYKPIGTENFMKTQISNPLDTANLYNGNIARQTTAIHGLSNLERNYRYDQLNRLISTLYTEVDNSTYAVTALSNNAFKNSYSYDADGNIQTLLRHNDVGTVIDNLHYFYPNSSANNKLGFVQDLAAATPGESDLQPGQTSGNYVYDPSGNLIADIQGNLHEIKWNAMGKVDMISDTINNKTIAFHYDGFGNRVRKDVLTEDAFGDGDLLSDIYVRDAQGNVLAVYKYKAKVDNSNFIIWLNESIINQHPMWVPNSQKGFIPFLIQEEVAYNGKFTEYLFANALVLGSWGEAYTSNIGLSDYASVAPQIKEQVLDGIQFNDLYLKLKKDFSNKLFDEASKDFVLAKQILQPLFMPNTQASMGIAVDDKLIEFLIEYKNSASMSARNVAQRRSLPIDYITLDSFEYYMHDFLVTNAGEIPSIIDNDIELDDITSGMSDFLNQLIANEGLYDSIYFSDANKSIFNDELFNSLLQHSNLDSFVNVIASSIQLDLNPNYIDDNLTILDRVVAAYTLNTSNFLGNLLNDGHKSIIDAAVSNVFLITNLSGEVANDWKSYMRTIEVAVKKGNDGPILPTYIPPLPPTLTGPDYLFKDTIALAEHHLYGSSRLGIKSYPDTFLYSHFDATQNPAVYSHAMSAERPWYQYNSAILTGFPFTGYYYIPSYTVARNLGWKNYELTDHLGNVNVSVLDKISGTGTGITGQYAYLSANISSLTDYYPFGMPMPGRSMSMLKYRFGFNTQEKDDEVYGKGNLNSALFWMYDTRLGRRWNLDPVDQIGLSNYSVNGLNPIVNLDPRGDHHYFNNDGTFNNSDNKKTDGQDLSFILIDNKWVELSRLDLSKSAGKITFANIIAYHARTYAGIKDRKALGEGRIGVDYNQKKYNKGTIAYTIGKDIWYLHNNISPRTSNTWDIVSVLEHERFHKEDNKKQFRSTFTSHSNVYIKQMSSNTFGKTSSEFKIGITGSFAQYLLNAYVQDGLQYDQIVSLINNFNNNNKGGVKMDFNPGMGPAENSSVDFIINKEQYKVKYEKMDDSN